MGHPVQLPPAGFDELTVEEQIDYVQALWECIAASEEQIPVPDWHRHVLNERLAEYRASSGAGRTWEEFEADHLKVKNKRRPGSR